MNVFRPLGICILLFSLTLSLAKTTDFPDSPSLPNPSSLLSTANLDAALRELDSRIQKDRKSALAYNVICRLYFQLENWEEAIAACEKAVDLDSQSSEFHQWLGRSYGEKAAIAGPIKAFGLVRKVKAEFERAVALGKDNLTAHADLAEFYAEAPTIMGGDKAKARKLAEVVMQRDPADAHVMLGRLEEKLGAKNKAEAEFKTAVESSGSLARYWVDLAAFYRRTGRLSDMESAINKSLGARLDTGIALFDAASLLQQSGRNFPGAIQIFRQYLSLDKFAEDGPAFQAHYRLGMLFEKQKDAQNAAREYRAALALASQYHPAQDALARVSR
ncbi:MAG TPA: tetratricopeptide repeat protein [Candidatus Solibacter sp.]|nr:tetratricopeptide repeat protein [Candidatus Solibacter sp.]